MPRQYAEELNAFVKQVEQHSTAMLSVTRHTDAGVQQQAGPGLKHNADTRGETASEKRIQGKHRIEPSVPVLL